MQPQCIILCCIMVILCCFSNNRDNLAIFLLTIIINEKIENYPSITKRKSNNQLSAWASDTITFACMHILCIALRYNKPNKSENHKNIQFIMFLY